MPGSTVEEESPTFAHIFPTLEIRPELEVFTLTRNYAPGVLQKIIADSLENAVANTSTSDAPVLTLPPIIRCHILKEKGNEFFTRGEYQSALSQYLFAAQQIVGSQFKLLEEPCLNETYLAFGPIDDMLRMKPHLDLIACCNNIAQCYLKMGMYIEVRISVSNDDFSC